jgi:hypothetical protein
MKKLFCLTFLFFSILTFAQQIKYKGNGKIVDINNQKLSPSEVKKLLAYNPALLKYYSDARDKKVFGNILGEKNKIIPKELKEAAEIEPLIFNKQWYFYAEFEPETILTDNLDQIILDCYQAGRPVELFFNELIKR